MKHHSLAERDQLLLERIRETLHTIEPTARIVLYGSRARGDAHPDSDWDLLILLDGPVERHRAAAIDRQLYHLELETDAVLSAIVLSKEAWDSPLSQAMPFHANVVREGLELWAPGSQARLLPPSPLRTARASFPPCRSSLSNAP